MLGAVQNVVNEAPILKQILPFVKTPSNLALQAIERSPLGIFGKNWENFTGASKDAVKIAETRGRVAVGTTILGLTALYTMTDNITGGYHPDPNIRQLQQAKGFQPYSFKIPFTDTWVQYGRLDPVGMLIGTIADYTQIYQDLNDKEREKVENNLLSHIVRQMEGGSPDQLGFVDKVQNFAVAGYKSIFKNIASKTYLRGLIDFLKSFDGEQVEGKGAWWINNKLASYWPNILTKVSNDPYLRDTEGFIQELQKKIGVRSLPKNTMHLVNLFNIKRMDYLDL